MTLSTTEKFSLKRRLAKEAGMSISDWSEAAQKHVEDNGLNFDEWLETGGQLTSSHIFTEAREQEPAATQIEEVDNEKPLLSNEEIESLISGYPKPHFDGTEENQESVNTDSDVLDNTVSAESTEESRSTGNIYEEPVVKNPVDEATINEEQQVKSAVQEHTVESTETPTQTYTNDKESPAVEKPAPQVTQSALARETGVLESNRTVSDIGIDKLTTIPAVDGVTDENIDKVGYAEFIENHASGVCQKIKRKNISLSAYGPNVEKLEFKQLSLMEFGKHHFLGSKVSEKEEDALAMNLSMYCQQSTKQELVIALTVETIEEPFAYCSLLYPLSTIKKFVNATQYDVRVNFDVDNPKDLVMVVKKHERNVRL